MRRVEPRQLTFVFADSPEGGKGSRKRDESRGRPYLLNIAKAMTATSSTTTESKPERLLESMTWFRRRRPAILLRFLRLLQFSPPALGNRPYDTGRRSLWSRRTAHHRSAPDPSRSSTGSSRTLRSRNAATARFASAGLDQPAAGKNDAPRCRTSPSRGGVHTWGTPFSASRNKILIDVDVDRTDLTSLPTIIEAH